MKRKFLGLLILAIVGAALTDSVAARQFRATAFEIRDRKSLNFGGHNVGRLFITVDGRRRKIAHQAARAWIVNDGREVVYSDADGSGGFENVGQALHLYDVRTRRTRKIFSEYFPVAGLSEVKLSTGARVLLVRGDMSEAEGLSFAVVDPQRGEVFVNYDAQLLKIKGDFITLAIEPTIPETWEDHENNWGALAPPGTVVPNRRKTYDLKKIVARKVIYNRKTE
jgi:hypothetical protein